MYTLTLSYLNRCTSQIVIDEQFRILSSSLFRLIVSVHEIGSDLISSSLKEVEQIVEIISLYLCLLNFMYSLYFI